ncbi:MAG: VanZ family protein [Acidobacteria bacterium OLB17]|nr:MAG: VanZ family protein [Acidobacteria bacterium OLB17]MCZ2390902.1 VanZ family protein [Acidobacteriota bacterium]
MFDLLLRRGTVLPYVPLIIWVGVVLALGTGLGAMDETSRFIGPFLKWLLPNSPPETIRFIHALIRKFAHFAEYFVLVLLAWNAFRIFRRPILLSFLLAAAVAVLDELDQSLNAARTSSIYDVLLDCAGAFAACVIIWGISRYLRDGLSEPEQRP